MKCNLNCYGCYSRNHPVDNEMSLEQLKSLFLEAQNLGTNIFVITGGEPLMREGLLELLAQQRNLLFLLFTNGSFVSSDTARQIRKAHNIIPLLSVEGTKEQTDFRRGEGTHERVLKAMENLREVGALFGFSVMVSTKNLEVVADDSFFDNLSNHGCRIGYCVQYVPSGSSPDMHLLPSPEQQKWFREKIKHIQRTKPILLGHMPDDEYEQGGMCMAAGRGFVHINSQGWVEPCPFAHHATHNVKNTPLIEALRSPFFSYLRKRPELKHRPDKGCALFEHWDSLSDRAQDYGAQSTEVVDSPIESEEHIGVA